MSELRASPLDLGKLGGIAVSASAGGPAELPTKLRAAARFGEGQLSGPFGPQFAGFGEARRPALLERLRPALLGLACGAAALGVIAAAGKM